MIAAVSSNRRCMKPENWPASDRTLWEKALSAGDIFDDERGRYADKRPDTIRRIEKGYGRWLTFLQNAGELDRQPEPASRITGERVMAYVTELRTLGNSSGTILSRLQDLRNIAKTFAPSADLSFISLIERSVRWKFKPARDKRSRLVSSEELVGLGQRLMDGAAIAPNERLAAIAYRDGLLIAFLALRPLRLKNLASLELGHSLISKENGWVVHFGADETKTHVDLEVLWPELLTSHLETYLRTFRPYLTGRNTHCQRVVGSALWVSSNGSPLVEHSIWQLVTKRTRVAFTRSLSPHLFRDAAATTLAVADPRHVRLAAPLLGHSSFQTTERHYLQAQMLQAHRRFTSTLAPVPTRRSTVPKY